MEEQVQPQEIAWAPQSGPQAELMACPANEILYGGARGGGKTDVLIGDAGAHAIQFGKHAKALLFRQSYPDLEDMIARSREIYPAMGAVWKSSSKTWGFPGNGFVRFRFLDREQDADRYQGHSYTYIGIDEAGNWEKEETIKKLLATIRNPHGVPRRMVLTANPGGPGHEWIKKRYIDPAPPKEPTFNQETLSWRVFIPARLEDNKILMDKDKTYEATLMGSGPAWLVRAWRWGDWNARPEGGLIQEKMFTERWEPGSLPEFTHVFDSWDTAFETKEENDYSAGFSFGSTKSELFVLDCFHKRVEFPELKRAVIDFWAVRRPTEVLVEKKASGHSLAQELERDTTIPITRVIPDKDKVARVNSILVFLSSGRVRLPAQAPWVKEFLDEATQFPNGPHDDMVDAFTQGVLHHIQSVPHSGLMALYQDQFEKLQAERKAEEAVHG